MGIEFELIPEAIVGMTPLGVTYMETLHKYGIHYDIDIGTSSYTVQPAVDGRYTLVVETLEDLLAIAGDFDQVVLQMFPRIALHLPNNE